MEQRVVTVILGNMEGWPGVFHLIPVDLSVVRAHEVLKEAECAIWYDPEYYPDGPPEDRSYDFVGIFQGLLVDAGL
jgi:hypothetical protein